MPDIEQRGSPAPAPAYALHRLLKDANDSAAPTNVKVGCNCKGYKTAHIQIVPSSGANPAVEVLFWSEAAAKFIRGHTQITKTALGAGIASEFDVDVGSRVIYVMITSGMGASEEVRIYVSGADPDNFA